VAVLSLGLAVLPEEATTGLRLATFAAFGALALSSYALCVVLAGDAVSDDRMVAMVGALLIAWAAGMMLGPLPAAILMDVFGPSGLFVHTAGIATLLAAFVTAGPGSRAR
jgi:hypothetical protein